MSEGIFEVGDFKIDINQFDFTDRSSRVVNVRSTNILLIVLVLVTVSLRLTVRAVFVRKIFADDGITYLIMLSNNDADS